MKTHSKHLDQAFQDCLTKINCNQETLDSALAQYPDLQAELRPQLEAALWLGARKDSLQMRRGFLAVSRARLVTQLQMAKQAVSIRRSLLQPWFTWQDSHKLFSLEIVTLVLLAACLVFLTNNLVLASRIALPGEAFYPLKLVIEQVEVALTPSPAGDARLYIEFTQRRTTEIVGLILEEEYDRVPEAVDWLQRDINHAVETLDAISVRDPNQSLLQAEKIKDILANENLLLNIMAQTCPSARQVIAQALQVTQQGLSDLGN